MGIKTREKKGKRWREGALRNHQSLSWVQVYLASFFFFFFVEIHRERGRGAGGGWREREEDGARKQHGEGGRERGEDGEGGGE